jgi:hypothetical protein
MKFSQVIVEAVWSTSADEPYAIVSHFKLHNRDALQKQEIQTALTLDHVICYYQIEVFLMVHFPGIVLSFFSSIKKQEI